MEEVDRRDLIMQSKRARKLRGHNNKLMKTIDAQIMPNNSCLHTSTDLGNELQQEVIPASIHKLKEMASLNILIPWIMMLKDPSTERSPDEGEHNTDETVQPPSQPFPHGSESQQSLH